MEVTKDFDRTGSGFVDEDVMREDAPGGDVPQDGDGLYDDPGEPTLEEGDPDLESGDGGKAYLDDDRPSNWLEEFLTKKLGGGRMSWGLLFLFGIAFFAIYELISVILFFFK